MGAETKAERVERIRQQVAELPQDPGCYLMRDKKGEIFYVGKARNLRARVRSYFSGSDTRQFVAWLDDLLVTLETIIVRTEKEALLLERTLVRQHAPRFNVLLQDDKNFIHLRLESPDKDAKKKAKKYPRVQVVRGPKKDGAKYFGPYHSAQAVRQTLKVVNRHFQLRTCTDAALQTRARPCLQYQIGRCPAPCVFDVDDYADAVADAAYFLGGKSKELKQRLQARMWQAAEDEHFEAAARARDQLKALELSQGQQAVTELSRRRDQDIIGVARTGSSLEIVRVVVRDGGMRGTDHFSFDKQEFPTTDLVGSFLTQLYESVDPDQLPDELLTAVDLDAGESGYGRALAQVLGDRRGKRVDVRKPARGHLRRLLEIAQKNAEEALNTRLRKSESRQQSLERLEKRLRLSRLPRRIECFDISIFQGTDAVASKVSFFDGVADKSQYRRFHIRTVEGTDDYLSLYEAITRRLKGGMDRDDLPDLLVVDGGKGQLKVAVAACNDMNVPLGRGGIDLAGLAKSRVIHRDEDARQDGVAIEDLEGDEIRRTPERVFIVGVKDPVVLRPYTDERYLMEQIRDEAHRFAITGHRKRRKKRTLRSVLDDIPGIGKKKRSVLLKSLGSVRAVQEASLEELAAVPGLGPVLAKTIYAAFHEDSASETEQ